MPRLTFPAMTDAEAIALLDAECTDFSIHNRDWPRHGFRWEVHAIRFFARGKGVGHTLGEAVQRALKHMVVVDSHFPRATDAEMSELLQA